MRAQLPMITPAVKRIVQGIRRWQKKYNLQQLHTAPLHWLICYKLQPNIWSSENVEVLRHSLPGIYSPSYNTAHTKRHHQIWNSNDNWTVLETARRTVWWNRNLKNPSSFSGLSLHPVLSRQVRREHDPAFHHGDVFFLGAYLNFHYLFEVSPRGIIK